MTIDNEFVRNDHTCPLCFNQKDHGLVVCWPCHRKEKMNNHGAYSHGAELIIMVRNAVLRGMASK